MNNFYRFWKIFLFWLGVILCASALGATQLPWLNELNDPGKFHQGTTGGDMGTSIRNVLIQIFKSLAIVVFIIATILIFVSVIRLLVSDNGEEDFAKWMNTLVWSIAGLFVISIAYTVIRQFETRVLSEESLNGQTIYDMTINIVYPILNFLRFVAATCFFVVAIYAFYRIVTAGGNEEGFDEGKRIFIGAILWFIIMILAEPAVRIAYGGGNCGSEKVFGIATNCTNRVFDATGVFGIFAKILVFLNGFIALITVIMIMYAGFLILTGSGDEEKTDKAKRTITYAIIGILILIFSYVLYRFMILQS